MNQLRRKGRSKRRNSKLRKSRRKTRVKRQYKWTASRVKRNTYRKNRKRRSTRKMRGGMTEEKMTEEKMREEMRKRSLPTKGNVDEMTKELRTQMRLRGLESKGSVADMLQRLDDFRDNKGWRKMYTGGVDSYEGEEQKYYPGTFPHNYALPSWRIDEERPSVETKITLPSLEEVREELRSIRPNMSTEDMSLRQLRQSLFVAKLDDEQKEREEREKELCIQKCRGE